ncbi:MAG: hypothetical protein [Circular genetic element sp.]|nr:MAG: hypothetical protein [Circular genetic element sp.]
MKIGTFLDTDNLPQSNLILEEIKFYSEWASDDYTFVEAVERSTRRKLAMLEVTGIAAVSRAFPVGSQIRNLPAALMGRLNPGQIGRIYGGHLLPIGSVGGIGVSMLFDKLLSRSQDEKPRLFNNDLPVRPKTLRDTKTFKTGSSGQTSKPFWANGKPKCKKGFRYDFKRKLCVKIK